MDHLVRSLSSAPPAAAPASGSGPFTAYTVPCRRCGRRLHVTEDELVASLVAAPLCWFCDPGAAEG